MKRIAIIDDEQDAREYLRTSLTKFCPDIEICGEADNVESAFELLRQTRPHAVLLDISLKDQTGFDLLDRFPTPPFRVIFTTAYDEFALRAFKYHALDYLLKPIMPDDLIRAVDRIGIDKNDEFTQKISHLLESTRKHKLDKIALTSQEGTVFLHLDKIIRLQSDGNYTTFYLVNSERHVISRQIREFEEMMPENEFFRLHQSHMVNVAFVKKILREDGGYAEMEDGSRLPIARRRKEEFIELVRRNSSY